MFTIVYKKDEKDVVPEKWLCCFAFLVRLLLLLFLDHVRLVGSRCVVGVLVLCNQIDLEASFSSSGFGLRIKAQLAGACALFQHRRQEILLRNSTAYRDYRRQHIWRLVRR